MADSEEENALKNETGDETKGKLNEEEEADEEEEQQLRDISESSNERGDAVVGSTQMTQYKATKGGLVDTQILNVSKDRSSSTVALKPSAKRLSIPRATRFLYGYFMLGYFVALCVCIIWGFVGISYAFYGYPGLGLAYFLGLFVPSLWAAFLVVLDFVVWSQNRHYPRRAVMIKFDFRCIRIKNGRDMTQGWYFIAFLYVWFGILLAFPAGGWYLPIGVIPLVLTTLTIIYDWDCYYMQNDYNGLYGTHINPWRFVIFSASFQFMTSVLILAGHFLFHWRCIYEPESLSLEQHQNVCHDWIPYLLLAVVYSLLLFMYWYKRFEGDPLNSNVLDKRVRYYIWFQSVLLLVAIIWMIVEVFDGHVYVYDFIGVIYLWFVAPVFVVISRSFKIR